MSLSRAQLLTAADEAIRIVLRDEGHGTMQRNETPLGPEVVCIDCGLKVSVEALAEEARRYRYRGTTLRGIGRCTRDLYRRIPGTPWFEYGEVKR